MKATIGVLIFCTDDASVLEQAVRSVVNQTVESAQIFVLVHPDRCEAVKAVLSPITPGFDRIQLVEDWSLAAAANRAIQMSRSAELCIMDSTDRLGPTFFEVTSRFLEEHASVALVTSWPDQWSVGSLRPHRFDLVALLSGCPGPFLARKDAIVAAGQLDPHFRPEEGAAWDLCLTLLKRGNRGSVIPEPLIQTAAARWDRISVLRSLIDKHDTTYGDHILQVLRMQDGAISDLLCANADLERDLAVEIDRESRPAAVNGSAPVESAYLDPGTKTGTAIVIPCFNLGATVVEAVDSALNQTRPPVEIVVVDDGSTDVTTQRVLASLSRPRTRIVRTANFGVAHARNHGIRLTRAPYVLLLDADDLLAPTACERMAAKLDVCPDVHFVTCGAREHGQDEYFPPRPCDLFSSLARTPIHISSMFRRGLWEAVGGFDTALASREDHDFWITAMERGFNGDSVDEPLLIYRIRSDSRSRRGAARNTYVQTMQAIYRKHLPVIRGMLARLLPERETFVQEQIQHHQYLLERYRALGSENTRDVTYRPVAGREGAEVVGGRGLPSPDPPRRGGQLLESLLERHSDGIHGRALLVAYRDRDGFLSGRVIKAAEIVSVDLSGLGHVSRSSFDAVILPQALCFAFDVRAALSQALEALKPGGLLLGVVRAAPADATPGLAWEFTEESLRQVLAESLDGSASTDVELACEGDAIAFALRKSPRVRLPRKASEGNQAIILMYHRIGTLDPTRHLSVRPAHFKDHMEHLGRSFQPLPLQEILDRSANGTLPDRAVAITFDDGYLDALTVASPILRGLGIPATFFVNTDKVERRHERWSDILERIFLSDSAVPSILGLRLSGSSRVIQTGNRQERQAAYNEICDLGLALSSPEREELIETVSAWSLLDLDPRDSHRLLTSKEIVELASVKGHDIGGHTTHHLFLPAHQRAVQHQEVLENKRDLERLLGAPVRFFAYPYGDYTAETVEVAAAASFRGAVTVEPGRVHADSDPLRLPRHSVREMDGARFATWVEQIQSTPSPQRSHATSSSRSGKSAVSEGLVSTIIPAYNRPILLEEAVNSVLAQTYDRCEIIVVDDGSGEETRELCDRLARQHSSIRALHIRHIGLPGLVREEGRKAALGEFIQYLDSDDLIAPTKFEVVVQGLRDHPECDIAYGPTRRYVVGDVPQNVPCELTGQAFDKMLPAFLRQRFWLTPTPVYRRSACDRAGPWTDLPSWQDLEYDMRFAAMGVSLWYYPEFLTDVRDHPELRRSPADFDLRRECVRHVPRAFRMVLEHALRAGITAEDADFRALVADVLMVGLRCRALNLEREVDECLVIARDALGCGTR